MSPGKTWDIPGQRRAVVDVVWNAGFRRMVSQLSTKDQERFKREHLDEVEPSEPGKVSGWTWCAFHLWQN